VFISLTDHQDTWDEMEAVMDAYSAQGLRLAEEEATNDEESSDVESSSASGGPSKKARRSSGGASSVTDKALTGFAQVMKAFAPKETPLPETGDGWLGECQLTAGQKDKLMSMMPAAAGVPGRVMLAALSDEQLDTLGLTALQVATWKMLAAATRKSLGL
jgi:hypothetical protein